MCSIKKCNLEEYQRSRSKLGFVVLIYSVTTKPWDTLMLLTLEELLVMLLA